MSSSSGSSLGCRAGEEFVLDKSTTNERGVNSKAVSTLWINLKGFGEDPLGIQIEGMACCVSLLACERKIKSVLLIVELGSHGWESAAFGITIY